MSYYLRFFWTSEKPTSLWHVSRALKAADRGWNVESQEYVVLHGEVVGQIELVTPDHECFDEDREWLEGRLGDGLPLGLVERVRGEILINAIDRGRQEPEIFRPLWEWLAAQRGGIFCNEDDLSILNA